MAFSAQGAQQGANAGAQTGNPWVAGGMALLGALFNKKPSYDPNQRAMMGIAQQLQQYAGGVPGSSPDEQAQLAQLRGLMGNEQNIATGQVLGALPGGARTNVADLMKNLASSQAGERSSLDLQALMESLNRRRQALMQSAQVYGAVGPKGGGHQSDLPAMIGNLAYQQAMQKAMRTGQQPGAGANDPRFQPGGSIWPTTAQTGGPGTVFGFTPPKAPVAAQSVGGGGSGMLGAFGGAIGGLMSGAPPVPVGGYGTLQQPSMGPVGFQPQPDQHTAIQRWMSEESMGDALGRRLNQQRLRSTF